MYNVAYRIEREAIGKVNQMNEIRFSVLVRILCTVKFIVLLYSDTGFLLLIDRVLDKLSFHRF